MPERILILGAAGRDFHDFNVVFRNDPRYEVVAFTATQIPNIEGRLYPPALSGPNYPHGIPIEPESEMTRLIKHHRVDRVVFAYSDVPYSRVMQLASEALAAGADWELLGPARTQLEAKVPVVAVTAARTGCGKSQTSRRVASVLTRLGHRVAVVRHPMPYGDLARQEVQRFATYDDLKFHEATIEEREEYEPHIDAGRVVFAGVDYEKILREAEREADIVIFDGGNNDLSFYRPDLQITVLDPHRAEHAASYHPGDVNVRIADVLLINKVDTASFEDIQRCREVAHALNPDAPILEAASPITVEDGERIRGQRVLVIEDGPTLTHGEMAFGAGWIAARRLGAAEIVDPRPYAVDSIAATYAKYPTTGPVLPAMGYGDAQVRDLEETIRRVPADVVLVATPIDLRRIVEIEKPALRARYELQEIGDPTLEAVLRERLVNRLAKTG